MQLLIEGCVEDDDNKLYSEMRENDAAGFYESMGSVAADPVGVTFSRVFRNFRNPYRVLR